MSETEIVTFSTTYCSGCHGMGHNSLVFHKLMYPINGLGKENPLFTHWASCPENGDPVLINIGEEPQQ